MNTSKQTILITGGGSGIGLAIAQAFAQQDNQLILVGRTLKKLEAAAAGLPNTRVFQADITQEKEVDRLVNYVQTEVGQLSILVNNAGTANTYNLSASAQADTLARQEFDVNFFAAIRLTEKLLPLLQQQTQAAIVNITSVAVYTPNIRISTYSASKAALHSYTQSLRLTLERTIPQIQVFDVLPPFVDTPLTQGLNVDKLPASVVAEDLLKAMTTNQFEIRNGVTEAIYASYLQDPYKTFLARNQV